MIFTGKKMAYGIPNFYLQETFSGEELHDLLESPLIQEKLYSTDKCLVPQKFVQALANGHEIQPKLQVLKELKQLT